MKALLTVAITLYVSLYFRVWIPISCVVAVLHLAEVGAPARWSVGDLATFGLLPLGALLAAVVLYVAGMIVYLVGADFVQWCKVRRALARALREG